MTNSSLTLNPVQLCDNGSYSVIVSNPTESVTSDPALLWGGFQAQIQSVPGSQLSVETSTDLAHWTPLQTATNDTGIFTLLIPAPLTGTHFYRALAK